MQFVENEVCQITESIWALVLGLEVRRSPLAVLPAGKEGMLTGCVQITGAWEGAVTLCCSVALARQAASLMFDTDPASITIEQIQDALAELANMMGGNLKALLPEPCHLSLPAVVEGNDSTLHIPGSSLVSQVAFECQGQPLLVMLLKRDENHSTIPKK